MDKSYRLKIVRMLAGYTQDDLATKLGAPRSAFSIWENPNKYGPAEDSVPALADFLGVTSGYLTYGDPMVKPVAWIPRLPPRKHHLKSFVDDLGSHLPGFLGENKFIATIIAELRDGLAILLGRESTDSKRRYAYNCLILADSKLASSFRTALKVAEVKGCKDDDILSMVDRTIETITINDIYDRMLLKGMYCVCNIDGLGKELQTARKRITEKGNNKSPVLPPSLETIFRNFIEALIPSIKSRVAVELAKFFFRKCEERSHEPSTKIADTLIVEFKQEVDRLGIIKPVEKPARNLFEPENEEFQMLKSWLGEKLPDKSTSLDQRIAFLKKITKGTDFVAWKENYENEVKEGKRSPLIWF